MLNQDHLLQNFYKVHELVSKMFTIPLMPWAGLRSK